MTGGDHGPRPRWPEPPLPLGALEWVEVAPETWIAIGPTRMKWTIQRWTDGRFAITLNTWMRPDWWTDTPEAALALVANFESRHDDPMPAVLGRSWAEVEADRDRLCEAAEAAVAEWMWGPWGAWWERLEPYFAELMGERSKKVRRRPEPQWRSDAQLFGFDAAGRVVVSRRFGDGFGNDDVVRRETLLVAARDEPVVLVFETEGARGRYQRRLGELQVPQWDAVGRLVRMDTWRQRPLSDGLSWRGTAFEYDRDRLVRVVETDREAPPMGWLHHRIGDSLAELGVERGPLLRLHYDEAGELLRITADTQSDGWVVYRRSAAGAVGRAARLLRDVLPERIARGRRVWRLTRTCTAWRSPTTSTSTARSWC